jgi:hypothetical protein
MSETSGYSSVQFALVVFALSALVACSPNHKPEYKDFVCSVDGRHSSRQDLIDAVIRDNIRYASLFCREKYRSVEDFKRKNGGCCDLDSKHINLNEPNDFRELADIGFVAGTVRVRYYCNGPETYRNRKYIYAFANVTSCGIVAESYMGTADPDLPEEFPNRKGN